MKRLLRIGVSLLGCTMMSHFGRVASFVDVVHAADPTTTPTTTTTPATEDNASKTERSIVIWLETILRVIYLMMWPLLALAGAAMDNSLVYGKIFNFTPALWKFWTIMRNFANFALGFLFLWAIFKTIFTQGSKADLFSALNKLVLGAILVQISWFALSVLIDLSTVATVAIGGLPLYAIKDDTDYKKIRFLKPYGIFQMDKTANQLATESDHTVFYACANDTIGNEGQGDGGGYFLPCSIDNGKLAYDGKEADPETWKARKQQFIDSRKFVDLPGGKLSDNNINNEFCVYQNSLITNLYGVTLTDETLKNMREDGVNEMKRRSCLTLDSLIAGSKGLSGPLFTLYASLLNISELALSTNHKNIADLSLEFMMRVVMAILLFTPLLVFAIIMIMRVGYLWLIIAASPILVLMFVNKIGEGKGGEILGKVTNLSNILSLIFLPVIGTFAISLCVVFLSLIQRANFIRDVSLAELFDLSTTATTNSQGESVLKKCYDLKITQLCFNESQRNAGNNITDTFSYLLINAFGLALMWTVVFVALKSSAITEKVVDTVKGIGESALGAIPFVPTPDGMVSLKGLGTIKEHLSSIPQQYINQQNQKLQDIINNVESSSEIKATNQNLGSVTTASDAKIAVTNPQNISGSGTGHTDYNNFFQALNMGAGSTAKHDSYTKAFADPQVYNAYGMDGMQDILKNWNNYTSPKKQRDYNLKYGKEMIDGLDAQVGKTGSTIKKIVGQGISYYFDTATAKVARYDNNQGMIVEDFVKEKSSAPYFESKADVDQFIARTTKLGGVQAVESIYPKTVEGLNKAAISSPDKKLKIGSADETTVTITVGTDGKAAAVTR